jgi:hypothetical protein
MKFIKTEGCTAYGWIVDGQDLNQISPEVREQVFIYLCLKLKEKINSGEKGLTDLIEVFPYEDLACDDEPCEQCGDYVITTTWEI